MEIVILVSVFLIFALILLEGIHFIVYGLPKSDAKIRKYVEDILERGTLNTYNSRIMNLVSMENPRSDWDKPFIAISNSLFSKWYIHGIGIIPRWSKYSKLLDVKHKELLLK